MNGLSELERVHRYHDGTKHHFHRFAQSLGFLDWASQPRPFRSFDGAPSVALYPAPTVAFASASPAFPDTFPSVSYDRLFNAVRPLALPLTAEAIGYFLRHALGLSAWKVLGEARWSLRVNPSSGNLHPTEAYIVTGPLPEFGGTPGVWHYAPDRHALERRSVFEREAWQVVETDDAPASFFVALASIHWRESWKYGERAFRYCQHDLGHAVAALSLSAAACGWRAEILPGWPQRAVATMAGLDRDEDYVEVEREEPACLLRVTTTAPDDIDRHERSVGESPGALRSGRDRLEDARSALLEAVRAGRWFGRASQLSEEHVRWTLIDDVAAATEDLGRPGIPRADHIDRQACGAPRANDVLGAPQLTASDARVTFPDRGLDASAIILQRRSAIAFDGVSTIDREAFMRMLSRVMPGPGAPWDALWWSPRIHLALFVHRVNGVVPGLYLLAREDAAEARLKAACRRDFAWERVAGDLPLWLLRAGDDRARARRVSCDQEIAADGFFSLGMIADFDASLNEHGASFYRHLFWESGVVGQVFYLEAEAAGARGTGIGCYFDDAVHDLLGLEGHAFQSLYHFTIGRPVEDARLTTEPGYEWG